MADLDWGRGLVGFMGGALSGYSTVLQAKMKEDYENRIAEANMLRKQNYAKWEDENITDPNRKDTQKFELDKQKLGFTHAETLAQQQMTHAEKMRSLSEAGANARHKESMTLQREQATASAEDRKRNDQLRQQLQTLEEKKANGTFDVEKAKKMEELRTELSINYAKSVEEYGKEKGANPSELAADIGMIKALKITNIKDYADFKNNKDNIATINNVKEKAIDAANKLLEPLMAEGESGMKRIDEIATKSGWNPKSGTDPSLYIRSKIMEDSLVSIMGPGKEKPAPVATTFKVTDYNDLAKKYVAKDPNALKVIDSLPDSEQKKIWDIVSRTPLNNKSEGFWDGTFLEGFGTRKRFGKY